MSDINVAQKNVLKTISDGRQLDTVGFDLRTIKALVRRDFVKLIDNKKGQFVKITAKGRKFAN